MEILINTRQARKILTEAKGGNLNFKIKESYDKVKDILEKSGEQIGENLTFLITWGASIGGMIGPLNDFIQDRHPEINDIELSLLLTGIIANYYFDNKKLMSKIVKKIKEKGLTDVFTDLFNKAEELKKVFFSFIESLSITVHKMSNIMSYAFIIPLIPMIYESVSEGSLGIGQVDEIVERLIGFGLLTLSGVALRSFITKLIRRFSSK